MKDEAPERIWIDDERPIGGICHVYNEATEGVLKYATEYIRADLARPKVKPLVWVDLYGDGSRYEVSSDDPLGYEDSIHGLQDGTYHSHFGAFATLKAAKAAAQEDYERRILAALEAPE